MLNIILKRAAAAAVVAGGAAVATAGARYAASKRINAAERLGTALLESDQLSEAQRYSQAETEAALAACAAYLINVAHQAAAGISGPPTIDPIGHERKVTGDRGSTATVTTTAHEPESRWQFEAEIPGVARVSGSRRLKSSRFKGPKVHMQTPDTVSIRFDSGYTANIESDLEFSSSLMPITTGPRTQLHGTAMLSDNRGNVGRLQVDGNGEISGTITRGSAIVGRFEGNLSGGVTFRQYNG